MRRAFTLLETLLALALASLLVGGLMALALEVGRSADRLSARSARELSVDAFFERIEQDLTFAIVVDEMRSAGLRGDATSIFVVSDQATITFEQGEARADSSMRAPTSSEWMASGVRFDAMTGEVEITHGGAIEMLPARFGAVRFRYHDGSGWADAWNSAEERALPRLVEVAVWYDAESVALTGPISQQDASDLGPDATISGGAAMDRQEFDEVDSLERPAALASGSRREPVAGSAADRRRIIAIPDAGGRAP